MRKTLVWGHCGLYFLSEWQIHSGSTCLGKMHEVYRKMRGLLDRMLQFRNVQIYAFDIDLHVDIFLE